MAGPWLPDASSSLLVKLAGTNPSGKLKDFYWKLLHESGVKQNDLVWWWWCWRFPNFVVDDVCGESPKVMNYRWKMVPWMGKTTSIPLHCYPFSSLRMVNQRVSLYIGKHGQEWKRVEKPTKAWILRCWYRVLSCHIFNSLQPLGSALRPVLHHWPL